MRLIDVHVHLNDPAFADDLPAVIARAEAAGVARMVVTGYDLPSSAAAVELAERYPSVWAAVGVSPHEAATWNEEARRQLRVLAGREKVVAIGEIGLDYHYDRPARSVQQEAFRAQLTLAVELGLPVVIHAREAHAEPLALLRETGAEKVGGGMHCFSGSLETARTAFAMGFGLSFAGPITFKNAVRPKEVARSLPMAALLTETDAPYLAPHPHRGERNEPALVRYNLEALAELHSLPPADMAWIVWENAERIFAFSRRLPAGDRRQIAYELEGVLYLNLTNACPNRCSFCIRNYAHGVGGYDLWLAREPSAAEVLAAVGDPARYREIVFCGFGEPTCRLGVLLEVARALHGRGAPLRLNTNGLGDLLNGRPILPLFTGIIDTVSVSLNAPDAETYNRLCRSRYGKKAFPAVLSFLREAKKYIPRVVATVVETEGLDVEACRRLAEELGAEVRLRTRLPAEEG
ncbi:MAG: YchF/TatD family DNA exonuclease [Firmicutes bacterium]|nr:YchF/TatD family DNA exonuclease [Bacillota bacterium]